MQPHGPGDTMSRMPAGTDGVSRGSLPVAHGSVDEGGSTEGVPICCELCLFVFSSMSDVFYLFELFVFVFVAGLSGVFCFRLSEKNIIIR